MRSTFLLRVVGLVYICCFVARANDAYLPPGADVSVPAFPSQLPAGSKPGTFRFSEPVLVKFKQQQEFPVYLVVRDYAHQEVFRYRISKSKFTILHCDLAPGSYDQIYEMVGSARKDYLDWYDNRSIFITASGQSGSFEGMTFRPYPSEAFVGRYPYDVVFRRRIETLEPRDKAIVPATGIHFRWKPIPGVEEYTISAWPVESLDHPYSSFPAERQTMLVKGCETTIRSGLGQDEWDFEPGGTYVWMVENGDGGDETAKHIAQSEATNTFQIEGKLDRAGNWPPRNYMRDESVEPRLRIRLQQPYIPSDGGDGVASVNVLAIGAGSPLLSLGLGLGTRLVSLDGTGTSNLMDFHRALMSIPSGKTVQLGISNYDPKQSKLITTYFPITIP